MRKVMFFLIILITTTACNNSIDQEAIKFATEFKTIQYEVLDFRNPPNVEEITEKLKPYLSDEEFKKQHANRVFDLPIKLAKELQYNILVQDITFEKYEENNDDSLKFNYQMDLILKDEDGNINYNITKNGQMTVTKTKKEWKISRDWDEKLNPNDFK